MIQFAIINPDFSHTVKTTSSFPFKESIYEAPSVKKVEFL